MFCVHLLVYVSFGLRALSSASHLLDVCSCSCSDVRALFLCLASCLESGLLGKSMAGNVTMYNLENPLPSLVTSPSQALHVWMIDVLGELHEKSRTHRVLEFTLSLGLGGPPQAVKSPELWLEILGGLALC